MRKMVVTLTIETVDDMAAESVINESWAWENAVSEQMPRGVRVTAKVNRSEWIAEAE